MNRGGTGSTQRGAATCTCHGGGRSSTRAQHTTAGGITAAATAPFPNPRVRERGGPGHGEAPESNPIGQNEQASSTTLNRTTAATKTADGSGNRRWRHRWPWGRDRGGGDQVEGEKGGRMGWVGQKPFGVMILILPYWATGAQ